MTSKPGSNQHYHHHTMTKSEVMLFNLDRKISSMKGAFEESSPNYVEMDQILNDLYDYADQLKEENQ